MKRFVIVLALMVASVAFADGTYQALPLSQNWSDTNLITIDDDWSMVPGIIGYRGDGLTATTGVDPQTVLADDTGLVVDVNADELDPNVFNSGGLTEFAIADPAVALNGSGTADAPYLQLHLNTTDWANITLSFNARDLDGSVDNAIMPVAVHFRVGTTGDWTNVPEAFVADASSGPDLAVLVTPVSVVLPAVCNEQAQLQIRIMTTNALGNDEWIGIDDISVTGGTVASETTTLGAVKALFR